MNRIWNFLQSTPFIPSPMRSMFLNLFGAKISVSAIIYPHVFFGSRNIHIGRRVFVSVRCYFDGSDKITIGDDVLFGPGVHLLTSSHTIGPSSRRGGALNRAPIVIESGCWIGACSIVMPGVKISEGCIIGAGSIVFEDTLPNGLYVGSPAVRKRDLPTNI